MIVEGGAEVDLILKTSSAGLEEVLWDVTSPHYYGHSMTFPMYLCGPSFDQVVAAFKSDTGVEYSAYGEKFTKFVEKSHARMYQTQTKTWLTNKLIEDIRFAQKMI